MRFGNGSVFMFVSLIVVLLSCSQCEKSDPASAGSSEKGLKDYAGNIQIGVRVDQDGLFGNYRSVYTETFNREFNSGTVTCYPAWNSWTGRKTYDLTKINMRINLLEDNGQTQMMHLMIAPDQYFPDWFKTGTFTNEELDDMMHDWIRSMMMSNGNAQKVEVWNVVNEALSWQPPYGYKGNVVKWHQMGFEPDQSGLSGDEKVLSEHPVYIRKAFEYSRRYTNAKLELRDSGAEFLTGHQSIKYKTFYQLVNHLLNSGTPLDAVGFQMHLDLDEEYSWEALKNNIRRFKDLGLEVYLTEIDIGDTEASWTEEKAALQKEMYHDLIQAAVEADVEYIHFWGMIDGKDQGWRSDEAPLLFDSAYQAKPAYDGVLEALQGK